MPIYNSAKGGHFYAVGIGPGRADLLTLRAVAIIESADIIIAPRSSVSIESLALSCIKGFINSQKVIEHVYPMKKDSEATLKCWNDLALEIVEFLNEGKSVVQITLGDPMIYSTSCYLISCLEKLVDRDLLHSVAGISAFQAAANKFLMPLTLQEDRFTLMGGSDVDEIEKAIDNCETMAIYKVGRTLGEIKNMLSGKGLVENSKLACYIEQEGREEVFDSLAEVDEDSKGYMSTILLRSKNRKWEEGENK